MTSLTSGSIQTTGERELGCSCVSYGTVEKQVAGSRCSRGTFMLGPRDEWFPTIRPMYRTYALRTVNFIRGPEPYCIK